MLVICTADKCEREARFVIYWPGRTARHCEEHAEWSKRVAHAMGFVLEVTPIEHITDDEKDE